MFAAKFGAGFGVCGVWLKNDPLDMFVAAMFAIELFADTFPKKEPELGSVCVSNGAACWGCCCCACGNENEELPKPVNGCLVATGIKLNWTSLSILTVLFIGWLLIEAAFCNIWLKLNVDATFDTACGGRLTCANALLKLNVVVDPWKKQKNF